uniref:G-protein coupled receptors family 1 profile domain-containing protein n=1 Tax=Poecilia mexicana TaxID=48701 RepID=A0A3B3WEX3_9TELE
GPTAGPGPAEDQAGCHAAGRPGPDLTPEPEPGRAAVGIDESYKYVFLPVCYSLTFLFSLVLNSVVLVRSCRPHGGGGRRWNTSLIYMVNLATTDLMYGLSLPFLVASYVLRDHWVFGDFMCRLVRFLFYFNLYCSIFFLTCISVHRYLGICHPMRTITLESKRVVKATCASVWVVVFVLTCPIFRFAQTGDGTRFGDNRTEEKYVNCWDDAIDKDFPEYVPYGIVLHLLGFFVPFVIIAWCYSQVVRTIFQSLRRRKSIKTIVTITLLFALCFLPFHVTRTLFLLLRRGQLGGCNAMKAVSICYKVTRPLASCNAWLNALLYFLTGDKGAPCCWPVERTVHQDRRNGSLWWPLTILRKEGGGEDDQEAAEKVARELQMENESKSSRIIF